ncbi:MAG: isocitrate dehydrogenase (NAD(+)) [Armatimonadetes bacterium]|nr:isocitrate dehydrogenase (NAD(+)) [Armatimonadota bacterium]
MSYAITLLPGDGIGPEVTEAAVKVLEAAGADIRWEVKEAGADVLAKYGTTLPDDVLDSISKNRVALKGPITTPIGTGFSSPNVALRKKLNLYASLRPVKNIPGIRSRYDNVDLIVVRENTEGEYSGIEHIVIPGVVESLKIITETASTRISRFAFEMARKEGRRKVTSVHKANIMKMSDGLFLECVRKVSREYSEIEYEEMIIDATCMQLVSDPSRFDVLLMENLYGDIVSDLCAGLVGGLGVTAGANLGDGFAVFEAVHGSAPTIAGQNKANPLAVILSAVMMLRHIGEQEAARRVEAGVYRVAFEGRYLTRDLGGTASTSDITQAIIDALPDAS